MDTFASERDSVNRENQAAVERANDREVESVEEAEVKDSFTGLLVTQRSLLTKKFHLITKGELSAEEAGLLHEINRRLDRINEVIWGQV